MTITIGSLFSGASGLEKDLLKDSKYSLTYVADPDKYCSALLKYLHPNTPNLGSVTKIDVNEIPYVDLIMAGTSCQNFSSQGDRSGLKGSKSGLFYEFSEIVKNKQPKYVLWENVTGATTHKDFSIVKKIFGEIGYEIDYDIFDAREYSETIQQRRRVIMLATRKDLSKIRLNRSIPGIEQSKEMQDLKRGLVSISKSHREKQVDVRINHGLANTLVTGWACAGMSTKNYFNENGNLRELSVNECEILMTWDKDYTKFGIIDGKVIEIPEKQRYKICGNGVVSAIIPNLLRDLK